MNSREVTDMGVAATIREALPSQSRAQQRVGRLLLADYPAAGLDTVASIAERAGVSAPTVLRLVTDLGFANFREFQQALRSELAELQASPRSQLESGSTIADDVLAAGVAATLDRLVVNDLERVALLLSDPKRPVVTTGGRFSGLVADYLARHLHQLRPGARYLSPDERVSYLLDVRRQDVAVVFDFRRYQEDSVEFAREAAARGATIVVFTDPWLSPACALADYVLPATVEGPSAFDSLVPATAVVETVVARVLELRRSNAPARMTDFDSLWTQLHATIN